MSLGFNPRLPSRRLALAVVSCAMWGAAALADGRKVFADDFGVAANGYDVVAYFDNKATRGIPGIQVEYLGKTWYFETQENADRFQGSPERYVPQFGGYCAYGVSQGYLAPTDPEAWSVINGKLYLNYNQVIRTRWLADVDHFLVTAEKHWPRLGN